MRYSISNLLGAALACTLVMFASAVYAQNIELIGSFDTPGQAQGIFIEGDYAFIADGSSGLQVINISNKTNPLLIGGYPTSEPTHSVFVENNYAYLGADHAGLVIADISDPAYPSLVSIYDTPCNANNIIVRDGVAYVADIRSGLILLDISSPYNPALISAFKRASVYDVCLRNNYAYLAAGGFGILIIDIADPAEPRFVGGLFLPPYHSAASIALKDNYAYLACGDEGMWVVDISNPTNPEVITQTPTQYRAVDIFIYNNLAYVADAAGGLIVFDISVPTNPVSVGQYQTQGQALAVTADNDYIYLADNDTGLLILRFNEDTGLVALTSKQTLKGNAVSPILSKPLLAADVGVTEIISPPVLINWGLYPLIMEVTNFGMEMQFFDVVFNSYQLDSMNLVLSDTFYCVLPGSTIDTVVFIDSLEFAWEDAHSHSAYTLLGNDENRSNDATQSFSARPYSVFIWYGNFDSSPVEVCLNSRNIIDVFLQGPIGDNGTIADFCFVLGANGQFIDSLQGDRRGVFYYPLTEWDRVEFTEQYGTPPNPEGWISQSCLGFARLYYPWDSPVLRTSYPTKIYSTMVKTLSDPELIGDTINCLGHGLDYLQGPSNAADTLCGGGLPIYEFFSPFYFSDNCNYYLPGDVNMAAGAWPPTATGPDVTYLVNYFRGIPTSQACLLNAYWCSADINGDCNIIGSDVTKLVNVFRGIGDIAYCADYPPSWLTSGDLPAEAPDGWPNCE